MSARLRANHGKNRRAKRVRRIAADQRKEAQRIASILQRFTREIRSIQTAARSGLDSLGALQGARVVTAVLPNGRRSRMRIIPTLAPIREVNRLRSAMVVNERRQAIAVGKNLRAIAALAVAQAAAVKRLLDAQVKSDKALGKRVAECQSRLDRRITKELSSRRRGRG